MGDINAVIGSGMTLDEVLVYYKLHKFQPRVIEKVKLNHGIKYPDRPSINLEEAEWLMNKITATDAELTKDQVAIEQGIQTLTMTAVPKINQAATPTSSAAVSNNQSQQNKTQGGYNHNTSRNNQYWMPNQIYCHVCEGDDHFSGSCPSFTTLTDRMTELRRIGKCQKCAFPTNSKHTCPTNITCRYCKRNHRSWLCQTVKNSATTNTPVK